MTTDEKPRPLPSRPSLVHTERVAGEMPEHPFSPQPQQATMDPEKVLRVWSDMTRAMRELVETQREHRAISEVRDQSIVRVADDLRVSHERADRSNTITRRVVYLMLVLLLAVVWSLRTLGHQLVATATTLSEQGRQNAQTVSDLRMMAQAVSGASAATNRALMLERAEALKEHHATGRPKRAAPSDRLIEAQEEAIRQSEAAQQQVLGL